MLSVRGTAAYSTSLTEVLTDLPLRMLSGYMRRELKATPSWWGHHFLNPLRSLLRLERAKNQMGTTSQHPPRDMPSIVIRDPEARFILGRMIGHLGTSDSVHEPHVMPICFALDRDMIYTPSTRNRRGHPPLRERATSWRRAVPQYCSTGTTMTGRKLAGYWSVGQRQYSIAARNTAGRSAFFAAGICNIRTCHSKRCR